MAGRHAAHAKPDMAGPKAMQKGRAKAHGSDKPAELTDGNTATGVPETKSGHASAAVAAPKRVWPTRPVWTEQSQVVAPMEPAATVQQHKQQQPKQRQQQQQHSKATGQNASKPQAQASKDTANGHVKPIGQHAAGTKPGAQKLTSNGQQQPGQTSAADAPASATQPTVGKRTSKAGHGKPAKARKKSAARAAAKPPPVPPPSSKSFSSNWEAIKQAVGATGQGKKRKAEEEGAVGAAAQGPAKKLKAKGDNMGVTQHIALDCEMVGVGIDGKKSMIARVCIINNDGNVLMDDHVKPKEKVTDYRTWVSGVKPEHLQGDGVLTFEEMQEKVSKLLKGSILVGHALHNDLKAMLLDHPRKDMRDTAKYPPLMRAPAPGRKPRARALRNLAKEELGLVIQEGAHSPVDDARAALYIYHKYRKEWERAITTGSLKSLKAKGNALRKAVRDSLEARAATPALARKARLGKGKGQLKIAQHVELKAKGKLDPYNRDVRDDPYADL